MLSASHWLLAQVRFCGRTHLPLSPNSTTPTIQVIFRYLLPDAPVFNITTVGMVTFRQSPCWYYPWADIILSTSSDTQHLWTWWHFGDHTGLINLSVNNIRRIPTRRSRSYITWPWLGYPFVSQNPREFYAFHSLGWILVYAYTIAQSAGAVEYTNCIFEEG